MAELPSLPCFTDERGQLVPVEFSSLPFTPVRCFVVSAPGRPADRGGHPTTCRETLVLIRGSVTVRLGRDAGMTEHHLKEPGAALLVDEGDFVEYRMESPDTELLVLADRPYLARPE